MSDLTRVKCGHCGSDELVLVYEIVGPMLIGRRPDGSFVGDGGPEYWDATEAKRDQVVWCDGCGRTTEPIDAE